MARYITTCVRSYQMLHVHVLECECGRYAALPAPVTHTRAPVRIAQRVRMHDRWIAALFPLAVKINCGKLYSKRAYVCVWTGVQNTSVENPIF